MRDRGRSAIFSTTGPARGLLSSRRSAGVGSNRRTETSRRRKATDCPLRLIGFRLRPLKTSMAWAYRPAMSRLLTTVPPNPRLQRTPSASPPSPLSRKPLGHGSGRRVPRVFRRLSLGLVLVAQFTNPDPFQIGDEVSVLSYLGEGSYDVWFKGKVREVGVLTSPLPSYPSGGAYAILKRPADTVWWVQIRTRDGRPGWIHPDASNRVSGHDACG